MRVGLFLCLWRGRGGRKKESEEEMLGVEKVGEEEGGGGSQWMVQTGYLCSGERQRLIRWNYTGTPILVPLTPSLYVPGKLASTDTVLVDIGTGFYVEKVRLCRSSAAMWARTYADVWFFRPHRQRESSTAERWRS